VTGLLLVNLGSPDAPTTPAVRRYLRQFLSDPRVIDINPVGRALLLNLIILPFRPRKSAAAYRKVWTDEGSPLLVHSRRLVEKVRRKLGAGWQVELGMRYGAPSIASALAALQPCERIIVLPLYPQYASSSTGSSLEEVMRVASAGEVVPPLAFAPAFHDDAGFLDAFAAVGRPLVSDVDHVLFSFHGLPERHLKKIHDTCLQADDCCAAVQQTNRDCYRAQCFATARGLAERLALPTGSWSVSFQSRLGRTPWIRPHTDVVLPELARAGKKRLAVFCPAFVADCLETLEEIGIRAKEQFTEAGGTSLVLVPSLNDSPDWVDTVCNLARRQAGEIGPQASGLRPLQKTGA
jgi:ferrochelatase